MKTWPVVVLLAVGGSSLHGQGTILFNNYVPAAGINGRVISFDETPVSGSAYVAQLFAGPPGTSQSSLTPVGELPFGTRALAGYLDQSADLIRVIPNVAAGSPALVQMRVWSINGGATWDQAYYSGRWDVLVNGSGIGQVTTGDAAHPAPMVGFQGFLLLPAGLVPEPSAGWLLLAGVSALWWRWKGRWKAEG